MKKILIIEDDAVLATIYRRKFELSGYDVETAADGDTGLQKVRDFKPDLVTLDLNLPRRNGVEVLRGIRAEPENSSIPVIVLSSFYRPELVKEAWRAGATKCISKFECTPILVLQIVEQQLKGPPVQTLAQAANAPVAAPVAVPAQTQYFAPPPAPRTAAPPVVQRAAPPCEAPPSQNGNNTVKANGSDPMGALRQDVREEFISRLPQLQANLRQKVHTLVRCRGLAESLPVFRELAGCVHALAGLAAVSGFTRIAHLAFALDVLLQELHRRPGQITGSTLRTIANTADCLDQLFREVGPPAEAIPQSGLILSVDDDPVSRKVLKAALAKANLKAVSVEDPAMALKLLQENSFDLIFLDADMPQISGFELCKQLRGFATNKTTPVVFVTSLASFENRAQSSLCGGTDLIAKPFLMMEMAVKALTYLMRSAAMNGSRINGEPAEALQANGSCG